MARLRKASVFVLVCLLAGGTPSVLGAGQRSTAGSPKIASGLQKAPSFSLLDVEGKQVRLEDFGGKVILIDFWASWCPPCQDEIPDLMALYQDYRDKGFVILGIAVGDLPQDVKNFAKEKKMNYPVLLGNDSVARAYPGVYFLPTAFLIDRSGVIREKLIGPREKRELEQKIIPLLKAP